MDIAGFDLSKVRMKHFCHRGSGDIGSFPGQSAVCQIPSGMFGVGQVHITDDIHNAAIRFLRKAFIFAAVAGFHMENRDMKPFGTYNGKTAVCITQDKKGIGLQLSHEFIGAGNDVSHSFSQVFSYSVHVDFGIRQTQVVEEYAVQIVVVVLPGMSEDGIEVGAAFFNHGGESDDFGAGTDDNQKFEFSVVFEGYMLKSLFHVMEPPYISKDDAALGVVLM